MATFSFVLHALFTLSSFMALFATPALCSNILTSGERLYPGQSLTYNNYNLTLQRNCSIVLHNGTHAIWTTRTPLIYWDCYLTLQRDGELVLRRSISKIPIWRSGVTSVRGYYSLVLRYDGTLQVYGPQLWLATSQGNVAAEITSDRSKITDSVLYSGDIAPAGTIIVNEVYQLSLLDDCNLVLTNSATGALLWQTNVTDTTPFRGCFVTLETNGELTVKHWGGAVLWSNNKSSPLYTGFILGLQSNGYLAVYGPNIWSTTRSNALPADAAAEKISMAMAA